MPTFDVHTKHSAPTDSAPLLASAEKAYGFYSEPARYFCGVACDTQSLHDTRQGL